MNSSPTAVIETPTHPPVTATLIDGWFAAWWPNRAGQVRLIGLDTGGHEVFSCTIGAGDDCFEHPGW